MTGPELPPPPFYPAWPPPSLERDGPAWEWRRHIGYFRALGRTTHEVLLHVTDTFSRARVSGGLGAPLTYYLLMNFLVVALGFWLTLPFQLKNLQALREMLGSTQLPPPFDTLTRTLLEKPNIALWYLQSLAGALLGSLVWIFVYSGLLHVALMLLGGNRRNFESTFRALAYAGGACTVIGLIPFCGGITRMLVQPILEIIALVRMHETDTWRVVMAYVLLSLPVIFCCGGILLFAIFRPGGGFGF